MSLLDLCSHFFPGGSTAYRVQGFLEPGAVPGPGLFRGPQAEAG